MGTPKTGHDYYLYYNTGTHASPTWTLIEDIGDLSKSQEWSTAAFLSRASRQEVNLPTKETASLEFTLFHDIDETVFDALEGFYTGRTVTEFYAADGLSNTNGTKGFRFGGIITQWPEEQPLEDIGSHDVTIMPAYFEEANARVEWDIYEVGA